MSEKNYMISRAGFVYSRDRSRDYGSVDKVLFEWFENGQLRDKTVWEARGPGDTLTVGQDFPMFDTRREAAEYLASQPGVMV